MKTHKPGTPEHTEAWQAAENAKNQNGGMPPLSGHTPGPWVVAYGSVYRDLPGICENGGIRIAQMDRSEPHTAPTERDANARLIAAAPELLAALESAANQFDFAVRALAQGQTVSISSLQNCAAAARAAISKAKQ